MAGDWIKIELVTPDKPEVHQMAEMLKIPVEQVLGGLIRIWIWADQQSQTGNALSVTEKTLDRFSCVTGMSKAMRDVGWITGKDGAITLPNFDRHNGKTAKNRALTNSRVKRKRNADSVTNVTHEALPEKRRKEVQSLAPDGAFERFYQAYPRKRSKGQAEKAWKRCANNNIEQIMAGLQRAITSTEWAKDNGKFIPYPATWLNAKGWLDEAPTPAAALKPFVV